MTAPTGFPHLPAEAWERFLADTLEGEAHARMDDHVRDCEPCRRELLRRDPSRAFRALRAPAPPATWDGFWEDLAPRLGPSAAARNRQRRQMAALLGAAASVAMVAALGHLVRQEPATDPCATTTLAQLKLTPDECAALFSGPIESPDEPVVIVNRSLDLGAL